MKTDASSKVSILIPTYKQERYIAEAVESALAQDYPNLEIIVADDCSPDSTHDIAIQYISDPRVTCLRNARNLGRVSNYRHLLYEHASGDWVVNLDGDDFFTDPTFISRAMQALQKHDDVVLVGCGHDVCRSRGRERIPVTGVVEVLDGFELFLQWRRRPVAHLAACYHRQTALETDFYSCDIQSSDWESLLRLLLKGRVVLLPGSIGCWRQHGENTTANLDFSAFQMNLQAFVNPAFEALRQGRERTVVERWRDRQLADAYKWFLVRNALALSVGGARASEALRNLDCLRAMAREMPAAFLGSPEWAVFRLLGGRGVAGLHSLKRAMKRLLRR